jgi:hypothetical protein
MALGTGLEAAVLRESVIFRAFVSKDHHPQSKEE